MTTRSLSSARLTRAGTLYPRPFHVPEYQDIARNGISRSRGALAISLRYGFDAKVCTCSWKYGFSWGGCCVSEYPIRASVRNRQSCTPSIRRWPDSLPRSYLNSLTTGTT